MSVASAMSEISVSYKGSQVSIETALDNVIRELQSHLNNLQLQIRTAAMSTEQWLGDEDDPSMTDLKLSLKQSDDIVDNILEMCNLFEDLSGFAEDIAYVPINAAEKAHVKQHKAQRKIEISQRKKKWAEERVEEKKKSKEEAKISPT